MLRFGAKGLVSGALMISLSWGLVGCLKKNQSTERNSVKGEGLAATAERCVALRGNGTHAISHLTSLARISSRWGEIHAFAGGSSSTITTFLYESILMNPSVRSLSSEDRARAISLLLKSLVGYAGEVSESPEWSALRSFGTIATKIASSGVLALSSDEYQRAAADLKTVLTSEDIRDLINPEILRMVSNLPDPAYKDHRTRIDEVKKAAASLTDLDASDPDVFVRPGLLNFSHFLELIGRVADFYAGDGVDSAKMSAFIKACSAGTEDLLWADLARKAVGSGTCGSEFGGMVRAWRAAHTGAASSRLKDEPGKALRAIMITSVVTDPRAIKGLMDYDAAYHQGVERHLDVKFDDVKFGYWMTRSFTTDPIKQWQATDPDGKSKKAVSLGVAATWRDILEKSPQEPSLGKYVEFGPGEPMAGAVSLGGWADLHPVQVLKAAGCGKVIYLTRRRPETTFISAGPPFQGRKASGLAELLGMGESDYNEIYNLSDAQSAFSRALVRADGVWCTDWNQFTAMQQSGIAEDGWRAPLLTKDAELKRWPEASSDGAPVVGCR